MKRITQRQIDRFFDADISVRKRFLRRFKDFSNHDFSKLSFFKKNFYGLDFSSSNFRSSDFSSSDFSYSKFRYSNFRSSDFSSSDFSYSKFSYSNFRSSDFSSSNFRFSDFSSSDFSSSDFSSSDFSSSDFSYSKIYNFLKLNVSYKTRLKKLGFILKDNYFIGYKTFGEHHKPEKKWKIKKGNNIFTRKIDRSLFIDCGQGINVGTKKWCLKNTNNDIWELQIPYSAEIIVPYYSDGKIRVTEAKLIKKIKR